MRRPGPGLSKPVAAAGPSSPSALLPTHHWLLVAPLGCIWVPVLNLPMVICGPGDRTLAHQPDEHVEVLELEQAARIYVLVIEQLLFGEAG